MTQQVREARPKMLDAMVSERAHDASHGPHAREDVSSLALASSPYWTVEEAAEWLRTSKRAVHELTRSRTIPHIKRPHGRRCLFRPDWLREWHETGSALEVKELAGGGRVVSPKSRL